MEGSERHSRSLQLSRDVEHVRVRIAEIDPLLLEHLKPVRAQPRGKRGRRLVAERLAEGEVGGGGEGFLQAIDPLLRARGRIVLFDDQDAAGFESLANAIEKRVPFADRDFVEHIDDRHRIERAANGIVVADDHRTLARVGIDDDRMRTAIARQHREHSMSAAEVQQTRAGRDVWHHA